MKTASGTIYFYIFFIYSAHADIVGGEEVKVRDPIRKSTAALYEPSPDGRGGALCTASIISNDTALTAAHCIDPHSPKPTLIFGNDIRSPDSQKRTVTGSLVNPIWKTHQGVGMDQGDIAVIKFPGGLPSGYQPIETEQSDEALKRGKTAILAGYGVNDGVNKSGAGTLRKASVKIDDPRAGKTEMILDQSHGRGACHGDSGGPAFVRSGRRSVLAGVTNRSYPDSAPDDCGHKVVYTKVSAYQPWIKKAQSKLRSSSAGDDDEGLLHARQNIRKRGRKTASYRYKSQSSQAMRAPRVRHLAHMKRMGHVARKISRRSGSRGRAV